MRQISNYIIEKFKINSKTVDHHKKIKPKDRIELKNILKERLQDDKDADLNDIDVSEMFTLNFIFQGLDPHNIDISEWDTSNVKHMNGMFYDCKNFNCDLSNWDVSKVQDMYAMFKGCEKFKGEGLGKWKVNTQTNMVAMFQTCKALENKPSWYHENN